MELPRWRFADPCHFQPKETTLEYRWLAYDGADAGHIIAPRSGEEVSPVISAESEQAHQAQFKKRDSLAPQVGARISPFYNDDLILLLKDSPFALEIKKAWQDGDERQRAEIKAKLHLPLKKQGPACKKCHTKSSPMLDFKKLGASKSQLRAIQDNVIIRFFDRFKKPDDRIRIDKLLR